jgi:hypothetical protein
MFHGRIKNLNDFLIDGYDFTKNNLSKFHDRDVKKSGKSAQERTLDRYMGLIHTMLIFEGCN